MDQKNIWKFVVRHKTIDLFISDNKYSENSRFAIFDRFRFLWLLKHSLLLMYLSENSPLIVTGNGNPISYVPFLFSKYSKLYMDNVS